jgi:GDPmannose 4,6-dehydratase
VRIDPHLYRPADVEDLQGDPTRAREVLGWKPQMRFAGIVRALVAADREASAA